MVFEKCLISNIGETPSYISLITALEYYSITTQMQQEYFESISVQRTKTISVSNTVFQYMKISQALYFGFVKTENYFIAVPEKAPLDAIYMTSLGRYAIDLAAIDSGRFNKTSKIKPPLSLQDTETAEEPWISLDNMKCLAIEAKAGLASILFVLAISIWPFLGLKNSK